MKYFSFTHRLHLLVAEEYELLFASIFHLFFELDFFVFEVPNMPTEHCGIFSVVVSEAGCVQVDSPVDKFVS